MAGHVAYAVSGLVGVSHLVLLLVCVDHGASLSFVAIGGELVFASMVFECPEIVIDGLLEESVAHGDNSGVGLHHCNEVICGLVGFFDLFPGFEVQAKQCCGVRLPIVLVLYAFLEDLFHHVPAEDVAVLGMDPAVPLPFLPAEL